MSLESFYGGKQGLSSIIKAKFKYLSVDDPAYLALSNADKETARNNNEVMEVCLENPNYETVWYGELCIIDTDNKNNPLNGQLYRRALAKQGSDQPIFIYNGETVTVGSNEKKLSAEYIGQIVGPKSGTPYMSIGTLDDSDNIARLSPVQPFGHNAYEKNDETHGIVTDEALGQDQHIYQHDAIANGMFIDGRTAKNDTIWYNWVNVRNNQANSEETDTWMYLGFQIPYLAIDYTYPSIEYWQKPIRVDSANKKFWQNWSIDIPRGVRGNANGNIHITTLNIENTNKVYQDFSCIKQVTGSDDFYIDTNAAIVNDQYILQQLGTLTREENTDLKNIPFYVYEYTIYNAYKDNYVSETASHAASANGMTVSIFLGLERHIVSFDLSADGKITAHYSDLTKQLLPGTTLKWIDSITVNSAVASTDAGILTVTYNTLNELGEHEKVSWNLGLPKSAIYNDLDGTITFHTTDGETYVLQDFEHKHLKDVKLAGDVDADNASEPRTIRYNTNLNDVYQEIGDPINYIQDMVVGDNMHLYVLFNDSKHRWPQLQNPGIEYWITNPIVNGEEKQISESIFWRDYGKVVKTQTGSNIGLVRNFTAENPDDNIWIINGNSRTINSIDDFISALTELYPNGFGLKDIDNNEILDLRGSFATVELNDRNNGRVNGTTTTYVAFDYDEKVWKPVQKASNSTQTDIWIGEELEDYGNYGFASEGHELIPYEMTNESKKNNWINLWASQYYDREIQLVYLDSPQAIDLILDIWRNEETDPSEVSPVAGSMSAITKAQAEDMIRQIMRGEG